MGLRGKINDIWQMLTPYLGVGAFVAICVALFWLFPARTAAVLLGILVAIAVRHVFLNGADRAAQFGIFWAAVAVTADAAYAKLNDQTPVTVVSGIAKFTEALVKLGDGIIRGVGLPTADARVKMASVTPDFFWALILTTILLMAVGFFSARRR